MRIIKVQNFPVNDKNRLLSDSIPKKLKKTSNFIERKFVNSENGNLISEITWLPRSPASKSLEQK